MVVYVIALFALAHVPLLAAVFFPGIAIVHFACAKRSLAAFALGAAVLVAPLVVSLGSPTPGLRYVIDNKTEFTYALWFFPGLMVLLQKYTAGRPYVGRGASIFYLCPLVVLIPVASVYGAFAVVGVTAILAILVIVTFSTPEMLNRARIVGAAMMTIPPTLTLALALPEHLELKRKMEDVCAVGAGMQLSAAPAPISVIAMEMESIYSNPMSRACPNGCFVPVDGRWLGGIEVGGDGWRPYRLPPGFYRYEASPYVALNPLSGPAPRQVEACRATRRFDDAVWCLGFRPIGALTADYVVRRRGAAQVFEAVEEESFEIAERSSGDIVARTTGFYLLDSNRGSLLAAPLQHILQRRDACETNGPLLIGFIEAFVEASR